MNRIRTLAAACVIAAIAAPVAQARPAEDPPAPAARGGAQVHKSQDLRSPDARDAARPRPFQGPPTWPVNPQPIAPASSAHAAEGSGVDWAPIVAGIAAALAVIGGLVAVNSRRIRRLHRPSATA